MNKYQVLFCIAIVVCWASMIWQVISIRNQKKEAERYREKRAYDVGYKWGEHGFDLPDTSFRGKGMEGWRKQYELGYRDGKERRRATP
jgi:hypothetical protein